MRSSKLFLLTGTFMCIVAKIQQQILDLVFWGIFQMSIRMKHVRDKKKTKGKKIQTNFSEFCTCPVYT